MSTTRVAAMLGALLVFAAIGWAQEPPAEAQQPSQQLPVAAEETTGEQAAATQPAPTPGTAADRERPRPSWDELMEEWMKPRPYPKGAIVRIDERYAYPHVAIGYKLEIVREDEDTVWMRGLPPEDPDSLYHGLWNYQQYLEREMERRRKAFSEPGAIYFLDFSAEPVPPPTADRLRFDAVGGALPDTGRWQMGFAVADMNGDGHVDLVLPPQRKAIPPRPSIFLGDGEGGFALWRAARWPDNVAFDYGGVAVADFDGDGHQDIAIACHFQPQYLLYGDGKGGFLRWESLPSPDPRLTSRAVTAADFDGNGTPEIAVLAEVDFDRRSNSPIDEAPTVWVLSRGDDGWAVHTEDLPNSIIGDVITTADLDGNGRPDLVLASNRIDWRYLAMFNVGPDDWQPAHYHGVLSAAYHFGVAPSGKELFATFTQFRMVEGKNQARNGLIRYTATQGDEPWTQGEPIVWDAERTDVYFRVAAGDLDGDGRVDLVAGRKGGGLEVWLQQADGQFVRDTGSEFDGVGRVFDVQLVDLNGDGLRDVIAAGTPQGGNPGGIFVWLTAQVEDQKSD